MTDKDAVMHWQYMVNRGMITGPYFRDVIEQSISALQESIERERGCKNCTIVRNGKTLYKGSGMMWGYECCPHCGRELKGADNL